MAHCCYFPFFIMTEMSDNMNNIDCPYAVLNTKGLTEWLTCSRDNNNMCAFQRRCSELNQVVNSVGALSCPLRIKHYGATGI